MPTLEQYDRLVFRFPQIEPDADFSIRLMRTLRVPDSDRTYPLPPSFGSFPLRHVEDYAHRLPAETVRRGGVIMPMWQAEAMWIDFWKFGPHWDIAALKRSNEKRVRVLGQVGTGEGLPIAVKIAAGKVNAITGEAWSNQLKRDPQDYLVSPGQPWLDGFCTEPGTVRQFVAMPLGEGYSAEEHVTGASQWGGLQISVTPLKASVWESLRYSVRARASHSIVQADASTMGVSAGGKIRQRIYPDQFELDDWDLAATERVFLTLVHARDWKAITGEAAPNEPPTAREYAEAGLPWFSFYGSDQAPLPGSDVLAALPSTAQTFKDKTGADLPGSADIEPDLVVRPVQTNDSCWWDDADTTDLAC
jgi:hypothetical protein